MLDKLVDTLANSPDTKLLVILRQIDISSNDIVGLEDNISSLKENNKFSNVEL